MSVADISEASFFNGFVWLITILSYSAEITSNSSTTKQAFQIEYTNIVRSQHTAL